MWEYGAGNREYGMGGGTHLIRGKHKGKEGSWEAKDVI